MRFAPQDGADETAAKAHYSLGVLMASAGRGADAIRHFSASVKFNPNYLEARQGLADAFSRAGRLEPALAEHARRSSASIPAPPTPASGMPSSWCGRSAIARLAIGSPRPPGCSPTTRSSATRWPACWRLHLDDAVRNGTQALAIARQLLETDKTTQLGETLAMAYAEVGIFSQALDVQRGCSRPRRRPASHPMRAGCRPISGSTNGARPCRTPWQSNDAVFFPGPPVSAELAALLPSSAASGRQLSPNRHTCRIDASG